MSPPESVLGVDPGRAKAGYAVVDRSGAVLERGIAAVGALGARLSELAGRHRIAAVALGRGTNSAAIRAEVEELGLPVHGVDEFETTRFARALYFADHPPRGWRRIVPTGLQLPPCPIDDYAAILIARRFLARGEEA